MTTLLPFPARREHFWPSLGLHLRTTTAIWRDELSELSLFGAPEIGWRRSPAGMELVWPGVSEDSDRILVTVSGHWQPLRDPQRAITTMLKEAEFEYEALRPIKPWALAVQPQDAALGLPLGEEDGPRRSRRYSAAEIDRLRMALRLASNPALPGTAALGQPLAPAALARACAIVAAWDACQAADTLALTRSGYALWCRIAVAMGDKPMALEITTALRACLQGCSGSIQNRVPHCEQEAPRNHEMR
ncbi:hypothetical protein [Microvirga tunisiensis]|uniref:Uncharacterized protein n=1 Tax=Microvirga tunisiensis TaxID=2108360 RepID=A0A5N7MMI3_9HYPH|nr:hypothetical protein [Microvirga tunisiensis]MPR10060.1 hypothetical protein [Microvirga tunisiensis]MPR28251.1 hypothetical protein [Microvirga tunisiensis]